MRATAGFVVLAALTLTGCTFQANPVASAGDIEALAASALAEQWNAEPTLDCGKGNVDLVVGTTVDCVAHNPNSGLDYPATITITKVDGGKYSIDVTTGAALGGDDPAEDPAAEAPTVTPASLADLAATALDPKLGYRPVVDCGTEPIAIVLDGTISCVATGSDGVDYLATITVTDVTETGYDIDVVMGSTPVG